MFFICDENDRKTRKDNNKLLREGEKRGKRGTGMEAGREKWVSEPVSERGKERDKKREETPWHSSFYQGL